MEQTILLSVDRSETRPTVGRAAEVIIEDIERGRLEIKNSRRASSLTAAAISIPLA
jgi:hypothetical protein